MTKSNYKVKVLFTDGLIREKFFTTINQAEDAYERYKNVSVGDSRKRYAVAANRFNGVKEVKIYQVQNSTVCGLYDPTWDELVKSGELWYKLAMHEISKR